MFPRDEVYGDLAPGTFADENSALQPNSPYSASKASSDLIVRSYVRTFGFPAVITRASNNYGPFQFPEKFLPLMITNALDDKPLPIYGDGRQERDWLHVKIIAGEFKRFSSADVSARFTTWAAPDVVENLAMARRLLRARGKPESLLSHVADRPGHDRRYALDCEKIERELGWKPAVSLDDGLRQTIEWYRTNTKWLAGVRGGEYRNLLPEICTRIATVTSERSRSRNESRSLAARGIPSRPTQQRFLIRPIGFSLRGKNYVQGSARCASHPRSPAPSSASLARGPNLGLPLLTCAGVSRLAFQQRRPHEPGSPRANSARVSTPNLLSNEDTWNFTVRTVIFNREAISLLARLLTTASSTSLCRALNDVGQAIARPSFNRSSVREISRATRDCSAGTSTWKSAGFCPRTRHCIASSPAIRSTVHSRSPPPVARNCAVPLDDSQKRNRFGWFVSCFSSRGTSFGKTRTFFKVSLPSACPGLHAAKLWDLTAICNFAFPNGMSTTHLA